MPRVSIGMPLYNAEQYVISTIESILSQTFTDFELVISDNGSSDRTEEICRAFVAKDKRIRYYRESVNRGSAWNHNRVYELSRGEYFKWNSYDDLLGSEFLEKCVAVLDEDPSVILCCTRVRDIDDVGAFLKEKSSEVSRSEEPHERFRAMIEISHSCEEIYGLMRSDVLRKTPLIAPYTSSDQNLLAELALYGRFREVPEVLFFHRWHARSSYTLWPDRDERWLWFDPSAAGRIVFPYWKQFYEYVASIRRSPVSPDQRRQCYLHMLWWLKECRRCLANDLNWGGRKWIKIRLPWVRTVYKAIRHGSHA